MKAKYTRNGRPLPRTIKVFNEKRFEDLGITRLIQTLKSDRFLRSLVRRVQYRLHLKQNEYVLWIFRPHFLPFRTVGKTTYIGVRGEVCGDILTATMAIYKPSSKGDPFINGKLSFAYPHIIFLSSINDGWDISLGDDSPVSLDRLIKHIVEVRNS